MSVAKFASLHGGLLARKGKATPATVHHGVDFAATKIDGRMVGEVNAESRSAKEFSALWLYLSDRIHRLKGNPEVPLNGHKHSFDTEMLMPEPGSHQEKEIPAVLAAAPEVAPEVVPEVVPESDQRIQEAIDARLSALVNEPPVDIERHQLDQGPPLEEPEHRAGEPWDGVERRKADRGLPPGVPERRKPPVFGKRGATKAPVSDISQKRFNA
jgi:chromosome partitioning protein